MKIEIDSATKFLVELMRKSIPHKSPTVSEEDLLKFRLLVVECLEKHYADHWYMENPVKGSGYRCIRINGKVDPILLRAGHLMGHVSKYIYTLFPADLTMWVDPHEVSYRFGEHGSICILYEDETMKRRTPSPPVTPPSKKIRSSPEPPATPVKLQTPQVPLSQQITPPQAVQQHQHLFSQSNNRRISPQFHLQHHPLALFRETSNCKDIMRPHHVLHSSPEGLYVSSWDSIRLRCSTPPTISRWSHQEPVVYSTISAVEHSL